MSEKIYDIPGEHVFAEEELLKMANDQSFNELYIIEAQDELNAAKAKLKSLEAKRLSLAELGRTKREYRNFPCRAEFDGGIGRVRFYRLEDGAMMLERDMEKSEYQADLIP